MLKDHLRLEVSSLSDPGSFSSKVRAIGDSVPAACGEVVWMCMLEHRRGSSCLSGQELVFTSVCHCYKVLTGRGQQKKSPSDHVCWELMVNKCETSRDKAYIFLTAKQIYS